MQHLTLSHDQREKARFISSNPFADFSTLESYEIVDLGIYWAYYSAKIESNTYTYVETECLLKDGITSLKTYTEATMLKNLYNTFIDCVERIKKGRRAKAKSLYCNGATRNADKRPLAPLPKGHLKITRGQNNRL
ncbi:hypothetical protein [uncultured Porphyromonas sp.]|uniref:hypothetical protein n=1 Tax=uncultured Porphyromonas sp. TaxID=159274 RepID=UPI0026111686|nr:hypothetical protein [uncultured Porphyromonas sp.]